MAEFIAVLPGDGWRCRYRPEEDGRSREAPVIGWAVQRNGVTAAIVMIDGDPMTLFSSGGQFRLYHESERAFDEQGRPEAFAR
jgi:hypothetical protein